MQPAYCRCRGWEDEPEPQPALLSSAWLQLPVSMCVSQLRLRKERQAAISACQDPSLMGIERPECHQSWRRF